MTKLSRDELIQKIELEELSEVLASRVEFKAAWQQDHGKDISAIANQESGLGGWLIIGINDQGIPSNQDRTWLKKTEEAVSNHVLQYLSPSWAVQETYGHAFSKGHVLFLNIVNPGEVVTWNRRAYKLSGTISKEMAPDEQLSLSMKLPGEDFSRQSWQGDLDGALVLEFAKKINEENQPSRELYLDLQNSSPTDILMKLGISGSMAAGILFGSFRARLVHYDNNEDILDQQEKIGIYSILSDSFIEHVQSWTRKQASIVREHSVSAFEETPYPPKALREVLANAVAHSLYAREQGNIIVELRPNRLTVQNNCTLDSKAFVNKWFSRDSNVKNKLLMTVLRIAKITDELGTGKNRIFRQMIESGHREPLVEFSERNKFGRWMVTLYNEETNKNLLGLISRLKEFFPSADSWRIATAMVLWQDYTWSEIKQRLDQHYARVALNVLKNEMSPVIVVDDHIFLKRWASVALTGQQSRRLTAAEEEQIKLILRALAFSWNRNGHLTTAEARSVIGLSTSQSEIVQLSNLFRKWSEEGLIKMVKRGQWQFLKKAVKDAQVIMPNFQPESRSDSE